MNRPPQLYGRSINTERPGGVAGELSKMLRLEILRGRWKVGERLPSYRDLADETGLSQWSVNRALTMLSEKGYVECIRQKGIFVKAASAHDDEALGRILLVIAEDDMTLKFTEPGRIPVETQGFGRVDIHTLIESAENLGLQADVCRLPASTEDDAARWQKITQEQPLDLFGIISLAPASRLRLLCGGEPTHNTLYFGSDDPYSTPSLTGNPFQAALRVTESLLRKGHQHIAMLSDQHLHARCEQAAFEGVAQAMRNAGLAVPPEGLPTIRHPQAAPPPKTTAVFAFSIDMARACVDAATQRGVRVPDELCITSMHCGTTLGEAAIRIPGAYYKWDKIVTACFEMLLSPEIYLEQSLAAQVYMPLVQWDDAITSQPHAAPSSSASQDL